MKKIIGLISLFLLGLPVYAQWGTPLSMYSGNQLIYNPAYAGSPASLSTNLTMRKSWIGIPGSPALFSFNSHSPIGNAESHAVGLIYQYESYGVAGLTNAYANYAYRIFFPGSKSALSFGIQAGIIQERINYDKIEYVKDWDDPGLLHGKVRSTRFDANLGVYYTAPTFAIGFSVKNIPQAKFDRLEVQGVEYYSQIRASYYLTATAFFDLTNDWALQPDMLLRYLPTAPFTANIGLNVVYLERFKLGASWQSGQGCVTLMTQLNVWNGFLNDFYIGYAYSLYYGDISPFQKGSHEISLRYDLKPAYLNSHKYIRYSYER